MAIELTDTRIASDRSDVCAISVGMGRWVVEDMRGWTLTMAQAVGIMQFADSFGEGHDPYPLDDPIWRDVGTWLQPVGLSIREAVFLLDLPCELPQLPSVLMAGERATPQRRLLPMRAWLDALLGRRR